MLGKDKDTRIPELSNNSCFQKGTKYQEIYTWMKTNDILFDAAIAQVEALSPSPKRLPSRSPQGLIAQAQGNTHDTSQSSLSTRRDLSHDFQAAEAHASPSPARPGQYADVRPVKPFSPIRELSPEEQRALSHEQLKLYNDHRRKYTSPETKIKEFKDPTVQHKTVPAFNMH